MRNHVYKPHLYLFILAWFLFGSQIRAGERYGFVIGVDQYSHLGASAQLNVAVSDAKLMADALNSSDPEFTVMGKANITRREYALAFEQFSSKAWGADCVVFYFAGHGIEFHGKTYLLLKDSDLALEAGDVIKTKSALELRALSIDRVLTALEKLNAKLTIVVLDACRNNPLNKEVTLFAPDPDGAGNGVIKKKVMIKAGVGPVIAPGGTLISYSADVGQTANDGLFTRVLTEQMKRPGAEILKVFAATRTEVRDQSRKLAENGKGVFHEPAEYCKLEPAALKFTFIPPPPESESGKVKSLMEELKEMRQKLKEKTQTMTEKNDPPEVVVTTDLEGTSPGQSKTLAGLEMIWCPPSGSPFSFGSTIEEQRTWSRKSKMRRGGGVEKLPQKKVMVDNGFWLAKYELTQAQWEKVMNRTMLDQLRLLAGIRSYDYFTLKVKDNFFAVGGEYPMRFIDPEDAIVLCDRLNRTIVLPDGWTWSIPHEIQWEYACRTGRSGRKRAAFSFGETLEGFASEELQIPGCFPANRWGFHDMHRGVSEIVFINNYRSELSDAVIYNLRYFLSKGGSWQSKEYECRSSSRGHNDAKENGLRLAILKDPDRLIRDELSKRAEERKKLLETIVPPSLEEDVSYPPLDTPDIETIKKGFFCRDKEAEEILKKCQSLRLGEFQVHGTIQATPQWRVVLNNEGESFRCSKTIAQSEAYLGTVTFRVEEINGLVWNRSQTSFSRGNLTRVTSQAITLKGLGVPKGFSWTISESVRMSDYPPGNYKAVAEYSIHPPALRKDLIIDREIFEFTIEGSGKIRPQK